MIRNKTRMPTLATFIQRTIGTPGHSIKTKKKKSIQIGKERKKHPNWKGKVESVTACR